MLDSEKAWLDWFSGLNNRLLDWGWLFNGRSQQYKVKELERYVAEFDQSTDSDARAKLLKAVGERMVYEIYQPYTRAHTVWRLCDDVNTAHVSHQIEVGTIHYMRQDYLSCVLTMLPAIEGMLLKRHGWSLASGRKIPSCRELTQSLGRTRSQVPEHERRCAMHRDTIVAYLDRWIFKFHSGIDPDVSTLNRHYVLHGMGSDYYRAEDCHRLLSFLDAYVEFVSWETGVGCGVFLPKNAPEILKRTGLYSSYIFGDKPYSVVRAMEEDVMMMNKAYQPEISHPDWTRLLDSSRDRSNPC